MSTNDPARSWVVRSPADLGRAVAGVRAARELSQAQVADALGLHRSYLAMIETGDAPLYVERVLMALRRLGATVTVTVPGDAPEE